jgi:hypothetical protein
MFTKANESWSSSFYLPNHPIISRFKEQVCEAIHSNDKEQLPGDEIFRFVIGFDRNPLSRCLCLITTGFDFVTVFLT